MKTLNGIAASDGIAIASAFLLENPNLDVKIENASDPDKELDRLNQALADSKKEVQQIKEIAKTKLSDEEAQVFDAHIAMLDDPDMKSQAEDKINNDHLNAQSAVREVADSFIDTLKGMTDNEYMQERATDVEDVADRVIAHLLGVTIPNLNLIDKDSVVIAEDLTPSDTAQLNSYVKGFATDVGGRTSHSAIMARSLEIAAVVGTKDATKEIKDGDTVIIDGFNGKVIVDPDEATIKEYQQKADDYQKQKAEWERLKNAKTVSKDGKEFTVGANIGSPKDLDGVHNNGAEAVGLYRTEFLYMESDTFPSEDDQFEAYKEVLESMGDKQVVIRTMDIGGDKNLPYLKLPDEMNPFLGYRAIRVCLDKPDMFRTQLRALLRASAYGNLAIMFPMIATLDELRQAKQMLKEEDEKLRQEGVEVADNYQVGMMMEVPAAAVLADKFAKEVDFFSIGTNDLIQYTMAADRGNEKVSYLYQPLNPSILRLIKNVIDASHKEGIWTGMCGEVAGDQTAIPLLVGMGLDEFSMSATSILKSRSLISKLDSKECAKLVDKAVTDCSTADEVKKIVTDYTDTL